MQRTQQEWCRLTQQIQKLKKQNNQLKVLLQLQVTRPHHIHQRHFQSLIQHDQLKLSQLRKQHTESKSIDELKKQWAEWSNRLEASILNKNHKLRQVTENDQIRKTTNLMERFGRRSLETTKSKTQDDPINLEIKEMGKSELVQNANLQLIQDIFLFGPNIEDIQNAQQRKVLARHQLLYPEQKRQQFQIYGNYLFPNELQVKHIREKHVSLQINKMIFKNNKKLDCNVFIFQGQYQNLKVSKHNQIMDKINPSKWMYALSIQFTDFLSVKNHKIATRGSNRTVVSQQGNSADRYVEGDLNADRKMDSVAEKTQTDQHIFKSNFCLCFLTYFPFISFLKDILIEIFDSVKLKRMNLLQTCSSFKQIDIYFFISELKTQLSQFLLQKMKFSPQLNHTYQLSLNQIRLKLNLSQSNLINEVIGDWGFKFLKLLDKDSLMDIFCYVMMEQSICFLSEDKSILTFVILLYVMVFALPFGYPHPCVSVIFNQQLLQTPFTAILGINKSTKWLQQNIDNLTHNKQNKLIVNLNQDEVKIKWKKKPRTHKSQRLKKIFSSFYRKIQTSAIPSIFKKKVQLISRQTTKQQNDHVSQLFIQLHQYYHQQILQHLPNRQIIQLIKQSCFDQDNPSLVYHVVIEKIQKYLLENRKKREKDTFIDALVQKQLFRLYIDRLYQIQ